MGLPVSGDRTVNRANLIIVPCAALVAGHIGLMTGTFKKHL